MYDEALKSLEGEITYTTGYHEFVEVIDYGFSNLLLPTGIAKMVEKTEDMLINWCNLEKNSDATSVGLPIDIPYSAFKTIVQSNKLAFVCENTGKF